MESIPVIAERGGEHEVRRTVGAEARVTRTAPATGHADPNGWSDSSARAVLQLMAESVAEMVGFEVAILSVVLDGQLVTMSYAGPEELRAYVMEPDPVEVLDQVRAQAEHWGRFGFLAAEDFTGELEGHWVVTAPEQGDFPDAWHPMDVLIAFLTDEQGNLIGSLSVDKPISGRRPDAAQRRLLERYAAQTERAVMTAFERAALLQQIAHMETARRLIRSASVQAQDSVEALLDFTHAPLVEGFQATGSWIQVLDGRASGNGRARTRSGDVHELPDPVVALAHDLAPLLWRQQRVLVVSEDTDPRESWGELSLDEVREHLAQLGLAHALGVPLGAGAECLGFLALTRRPQDPPWSQVELDSALGIGHDLGAALMTAQALEREREVVRELKQNDDYRAQLISILSHEIRTPLTVISANLEMLGSLELEPPAARYRGAMVRGTGRMQKVVDDLVMLARVSHPKQPLVRVPVDLHQVVEDVVAVVEPTARAKGLSLHTSLEEADLVVQAHVSEIDRLLGHLVSNAVKFTQPGGNVWVSAVRRGSDAVLTVADDGIGIAEEDKAALFRSFWRSTNPEAMREPGTGLGLTIVTHIAQRHDALVEVASTPGSGTTFTVTLPVAPTGG